MKKSFLFFFWLLSLSGMTSLRALPPMLEPSSGFEHDSQELQGTIGEHDEVACRAEAFSTQSRATKLSLSEDIAPASNMDDGQITKQPCDKSLSSIRISCMERIRQGLASLPNFFCFSRNRTIVGNQQKGNLEGVLITPAISERSYLSPTVFEHQHGIDEESKFLEGEPPKSVSFGLPAEEDKLLLGENESISAKIVEEVPNTFFPRQEEITERSLQFAQIRNNLVKALKALPKEDPERSLQTAAIYARLYPQARDFVQEDPELQNEFAAIFLADTTIKVIEMASKSVAPEEITPIKKVRPFFKMPAQPIKIPFEMVEFNVNAGWQLPPSELEGTVIIDTANNAIQNIQEVRDVLKQSPDKIGELLYQAQKKRASRACRVAGDQYKCTDAREDLILAVPEIDRDHTLLVAARFKVKLAFSKERSKIWQAIEGSEIIADSNEAKNIKENHQALFALLDLLGGQENLKKTFQNNLRDDTASLKDISSANHSELGADHEKTAETLRAALDHADEVIAFLKNTTNSYFIGAEDDADDLQQSEGSLSSLSSSLVHDSDRANLESVHEESAGESTIPGSIHDGSFGEETIPYSLLHLANNLPQNEVALAHHPRFQEFLGHVGRETNSHLGLFQIHMNNALAAEDSRNWTGASMHWASAAHVARSALTSVNAHLAINNRQHHNQELTDILNERVAQYAHWRDRSQARAVQADVNAGACCTVS